MMKLIVLAVMALTLGLPVAAMSASAKSHDKIMLKHGRLLVMTGGCNDCHTTGYANKAGNVPETLWLLGDTVGWRGPWGTTYPMNLRLIVQESTEQQWIERLRTVQPRPPMPWYDVRKLSDYDLASIYRFIRSLGPAGKPAPAYLPPGRTPNPPYWTLVLPTPPAPANQ